MATSASKAAPKSAKADEADAPPNKSKKFLFLVLGALLLSVASAGGAWYYLNSEQSKVEAPKPPVFMTMDMFTVNLQVEDIQQYLQIGMTLQVADQDQIDLIRLYMPQVRSRILMLLSSKKPSELMSSDGKQKLSAEIIAQVRKPFAEGGQEASVSDVFFTSFVVQ
jgi:flagellar FliL protein